MKNKASIFTKITLGLLVAGSIAACKQNPAATATTPAAATITTDPAKGEIVFVNSDSLLSKYAYAKDMEKRLNDKGTTAKADLQSKGEAFQREVTDYQQKAATMPADQRQTTEQRLEREKEQFQSYQQNATAEFQNDQSTETGKLYDKIADYTKQYAKEKGYKMILTFSKANPTVLYGDPSLDVTADVVKGLNDAYAKEGTK
jgi:outer membrane protein